MRGTSTLVVKMSAWAVALTAPAVLGSSGEGELAPVVSAARQVPDIFLHEARRALQDYSGKEVAVGDDACKACTLTTAKYVMEFVWNKVTEKCDKIQPENEKDEKAGAEVQCPKMKMWCAFVKAHPKMAEGFLLEKVRPMSLGYMYCLGKGSCKMDPDGGRGGDPVAAMMSPSDDNESLYFFDTGSEQLDLFGNVGDMVARNLGDMVARSSDEFSDGEHPHPPQMLMWEQVATRGVGDAEHEGPLGRAMHFVKHMLGLQELPPPETGAPTSPNPSMVQETGEEPEGKGKGGKGKGDDAKGKGGKGKGDDPKGKGKGDDPKGKGKGKGGDDDDDSDCPADTTTPENTKEEAAIAVPEIKGICKCCFRRLTRRVMAHAVKMTKAICGKTDKPMVKAFCKWGADHPEMAFGVLLAKVEPEKYALIPCMRRGRVHDQHNWMVRHNWMVHHRDHHHGEPVSGVHPMPPLLGGANDANTILEPRVPAAVPKKFRGWMKTPEAIENTAEAAAVGEEPPELEYYV